MIRATFKNTVKTLFRSRSVWLMLAVYAYIVIKGGFSPHVIYLFDTPEHISFREFAVEVSAAIYGGIDYPLPLFTVVATALIVNRDIGDFFFEIEKAANVSPLRYLLGRICAIAAVAFTAQWIFSFTELVIQIHVRGGLEGYTFLPYLGVTILRLTFENLFTALPNILFYIGLVYLVGMLTRNGVAATVTGFGYAIASYYGWLRLRHKIGLVVETYVGYINPLAEKLRYYFMYLGVEGEQSWFGYFSTSLGKALVCIAILVGVGAVCAAIAYMRIRKRET